MTARTRERDEHRPAAAGGARAGAAATPLAGPAGLTGLLIAAIQATRPRQWPKNLLVLAAPLAGATLGRAHGFGYALVAFAAFTAAA